MDQKQKKYINLIEELKNKGLIVNPIIEDYYELKGCKNSRGEVGIRVNLDIKVQAHWDKNLIATVLPKKNCWKSAKLGGLSTLHYHISKQIETIDGFTKPIKRALALFAKMKEKNPSLDTLDIGGGAGVPLEKKKHFYSGKSLIQQIIKTAKKESDKLGIKHPNLIVEWEAMLPRQRKLLYIKF